MGLSQIDTVLIVIIGVVLMIILLRPAPQPKENLGGYGVISSMAMYNRDQYCDKGNGAGWAGGCFLPHRVII